MDAERLLYRDRAERERLLDMGRRLMPANLRAVAVLLVALAVSVPVYGWRMFVPLLAAAAFFGVTALPAIRRRWRGLPGLAAFVFAQVMVLAAVALAEGPVVYLLCLPIVPMVLVATGLRRETVAVASVATIAGLVAVTLLAAREQIAAIPPALWVPVLLLIVMVLSAMAVRDADMVTRGDAVIDELTGLLNRTALRARVAEVTHQVRATHERVGLVVVDLDRFKAVNDTHGHAAGDRVLAEAARRLAAAAGDHPVYRFGGEEFVVLLPGSDETSARELAEAMRAAVAAAPAAGLDVTASFGVALSAPDDGFDYRRVFAEADAALYAAKALGRDRVRVAGAVPAPIAARSPGAPDGPRPEASAAPGAPSVPDAPERTWLVRDAIARAHLVDIVTRTRSFTKLTSGLVALAILSMVPWVGWEMLVPVLAAGLVVEVGTRAVLVRPRPEHWFVGSFIAMQVGAAGAVLLAGPAIFFALPIFAIAMFGCGASLPGRGAALLVATGTLSMTAATFAAGTSEVLANPTVLTVPLALTVALGIVGSAMGARVAELRVAAISDSLTGALNRVALEARIAELAHRSGAPVALLVADLDRFKVVNDEHGHETGDRVLAEVARRMRGELRAFDAMYRIGGEEFVIVLHGAGTETAAAVAERIRRSVAQRPVAATPMTVSIGVAGSPASAPFDYDATFAMADAALLAAKREGRDRVVVGGTSTVAPVVASGEDDLSTRATNHPG